MTHKEIVQKTAKYLKRHERNIVLPNCPYVYTELVCVNNTGEIPDIIGFNYCISIMIEVKTTRTDFLNDKKKRARQNNNEGMGQMKLYCCPENMIRPEEIPTDWGLLYITDKGKITMIQTPKRHDANIITERSLLLSVIRRSIVNKTSCK
jgi:hypothetical protein